MTEVPIWVCIVFGLIFCWYVFDATTARASLGLSRKLNRDASELLRAVMRSRHPVEMVNRYELSPEEGARLLRWLHNQEGVDRIVKFDGSPGSN